MLATITAMAILIAPVAGAVGAVRTGGTLVAQIECPQATGARTLRTPARTVNESRRAISALTIEVHLTTPPTKAGYFLLGLF